MNETMTPLQMGGFLMLAGMTVVFVALVTLMLALEIMTRFGDAKPAPAPAGPIAAVEPEVSGVVLAAIATTLLLDAQQLEQEERLVLTVRAMPKPYSNWWQGRMARAEMWRPQVTGTRTDAMRAPQHGSDGTR